MDRSVFLAELHQRFELPLSSMKSLVERTTGHQIAEVHRLVRGDENEVHRVTLVNGSAVFVRAGFPDCPPGKISREAEVMQLARAARVPAPAVLAVESLATEQGERQTMVLEGATGTQLSEVLPSLSRVERTRAMQNVGRLLGLLSTVRLPGHGRPDEQGHWPDPNSDRRRYLADVRADSQLLEQVDLTKNEIQQIGEVLDAIAAVPMSDPPVLCHGDISAEHLFVHADQAVTGLIDWGMWGGGTTADELAALSTRVDQDDYSTVFAHHLAAAHTSLDLRQKVATSLLTQSIGELAWLIRSRQSTRRQTLTKAIRRSVRELQSVT